MPVPPMAPGLLGALVNLDQPGHYLHWGVIQISVANALVILLMIAVFILAIALPFPRHKQLPARDEAEKRNGPRS